MEFAMLIKYNDRKFEKEIDEIFTEHHFTKEVQENGEVFYCTGGKDGFGHMGVAYLDIHKKDYFECFDKWEWHEDGSYVENILSQLYEL